MILIFALAAASLIITAAVVVAHFLAPHGTRGADAFADEADRDDPYGEKYAASLHGPDDGFWEQRAGELATGTGQFPMLPDDPPADITGVQDHDVKYLGMTSEEYVNQLVEQAKNELPDVIA